MNVIFMMFEAMISNVAVRHDLFLSDDYNDDSFGISRINYLLKAVFSF